MLTSGTIYLLGTASRLVESEEELVGLVWSFLIPYFNFLLGLEVAKKFLVVVVDDLESKFSNSLRLKLIYFTLLLMRKIFNNIFQDLRLMFKFR